MDRITAAKVFIDVSKTGSFTASADRLDMSRPMVTRYIETMENWLETRLLNRTTRKVSLTSAGERYLDHVEQLVDQAESLSFLNTTHGELTGTVRIAVSMSFGHAQLIPALKNFMANNPRVIIDMDLRDTTNDLTRDRIDLAIRISSNPDPSLIGKPISVCESVLVASPSYIDTHAPITCPSDLSTHQCLGYRNFAHHVWHLQNGELSESIDIQCKLTANEATSLLYGSIEGMGISMQPTYMADKYIQSGELVPILGEWKPQDMQVYVLFPLRKNMAPAVRAVIDYLSDYFQRVGTES
ncbi:LysR family transcriptional regulator [Enterovibrio calviensis]|uniref:LysR family transcriptional regulator n=1 Tax=Enterovibrio calviensis TaxID=91359 RepID=UPI0037356CD9